MSDKSNPSFPQDQSRTTQNENLNDLSSSELISRITALEQQLKKTTAQLATFNIQSQTHSTPSTPQLSVAPAGSKPGSKVKKSPKPFDPSAYASRHIALKFSYIGAPYNGFEHANNLTSAPAKPTIEEVLWKALRKVRLIGPSVPAGADQSYEVVWDERARASRYGVGMEGVGQGKKGSERLELVWDGLAYSKCGRTDKGVSAFGQVIGITVRSSRPVAKRKKSTQSGHEEDEEDLQDANAVVEPVEKVTTTGNVLKADWDPIRDELPYVSMLNSVLPPTIRILAWSPDPSSSFDARFSCRERRYKYFFTNPAMCPTPGNVGRKNVTGSNVSMREGWLDIAAMKEAAKKLEGLHDFRNFCKIDPSKQMPSCERRVMYADIEEFDDGMAMFSEDPRMNQNGSFINGLVEELATSALDQRRSPKVYAFAVHGTAFLWHQVRCMVAILFLVGQGLEQPDIVDKLLDITSVPGKPQYEMADDAPLVLWDCVFPGDDPEETEGVKWIYAGDEATQTTVSVKGDGKFGAGGLVEQLWIEWRDAKLRETLTAGLLGLALRQGDGSTFERGGQRSTDTEKKRTQRVFDGGSEPRLAGEYVPVMQKRRKETLEVQNAKYAAGKQARRDAKRADDNDNS